MNTLTYLKTLCKHDTPLHGETHEMIEQIARR